MMHKSHIYNLAPQWPVDRRELTVRRKRACLKCLNKHPPNFGPCQYKPKCNKCSFGHQTILCRFNAQQNRSRSSAGGGFGGSRGGDLSGGPGNSFGGNSGNNHGGNFTTVTIICH